MKAAGCKMNRTRGRVSSGGLPYPPLPATIEPKYGEWMRTKDIATEEGISIRHASRLMAQRRYSADLFSERGRAGLMIPTGSYLDYLTKLRPDQERIAWLRGKYCDRIRAKDIAVEEKITRQHAARRMARGEYGPVIRKGRRLVWVALETYIRAIAR